MADFGSDNPPQMENFGVPAGENAEKQISGWTEREVLDYSAMAGDSGAREFGGSARVYEWKEEYGDLGPRIPEFEKELFGNPANHGDSGAGLDFSK
jgi:ATP-dependent RNA helicase DDX3X